MTDVLDFAKPRKAYSERSANRWRSRQAKSRDQIPVAVSSEKDLFLQMIRLSSGDAIQDNWHRVVLHEIANSISAARAMRGRLSEPSLPSMEFASTDFH